MIVKVSADNRVALEDRRNFRAFKLVIEGSPAKLDDFRRALLDVAELLDRNTAWVFEGTLRRWPEVAQDSPWQQALTVMIEKAKPHGWFDERRVAIKAHVEWVRPIQP
jgi:hypothetical protein